MTVIVCGNCTTEITQVETGSWIDERGVVYCAIGAVITSPTLHAPLLTPEWRAEIRRLYGSSSRTWTPKELGRLMSLTEDQIKDVLENP
jgi:hypothetical protein